MKSEDLPEEHKLTLNEIIAQAEAQGGDVTDDLFLEAEEEAVPELIKRGVIYDAEDEGSVQKVPYRALSLNKHRLLPENSHAS